jgi:hypothetical protein
MDRITIKHLERLADRINVLMDTPRRYSSIDGTSAIGHFHLSRAYGGFEFVQTVNAGGGERSVFSCGHQPARLTYRLMLAYLIGLEEGRQNARDESIPKVQKAA